MGKRSRKRVEDIKTGKIKTISGKCAVGSWLRSDTLFTNSAVVIFINLISFPYLLLY